MTFGRLGALLVVGSWLVAALVGAPVAIDLAGAAHDNARTMLAADAESTRALQPATNAIVVYERTTGLRSEDWTKINADAAQFAQFAHSDIVQGPTPSEDGTAAETVVPLNLHGGDWAEADRAVAVLRDIATDGLDPPTVSIGGPAARAAEAHAAFTGVDSTVLWFALLLVALVLVVTARSAVRWLPPMLASVAALAIARTAVGLLARAGRIDLDSSTVVLLDLLVLGAAARIGVAWLRGFTGRIAGPVAGVLVLLCLRLAQVEQLRNLGTAGAVAVGVAAAVALTLLPALRYAAGVRVGGPLSPWRRAVDALVAAPAADVRSGRSWVPSRPRMVATLTAGGLAVVALGGFWLQLSGSAGTPSVRGGVDSVRASTALVRHFPLGAGGPVTIISSPAGAAPVHLAAMGTAGVIPSSVTKPQIFPLYAVARATLTTTPDSQRAMDTIDALRAALDAIPGADPLVGGETATLVDTRIAAIVDRGAVVPAMLMVLCLTLGVALRSWIAPLVVAAGTTLAFGAAVGVSALVVSGADPALPTIVFAILLVSAVDNAVVLLTHTRRATRDGSVAQAVRVGLRDTLGPGTATGLLTLGVGVVLATAPVANVAQVGLVVAVGAGFDLLVVRPLLIPAVVVHMGHRVWPAWRFTVPNALRDIRLFGVPAGRTDIGV